MRTLGRTLTLALAALCIAPAAHAAPAPAGTLTCFNNFAPALTININSLFFDTFSSNYFTVYTDATDFDNLVYQEFVVNAFDYCQFSISTRTFPNVVKEEGVAVSIGPGGTYTQVTFSYGNLTSFDNAAKAAPAALTPEEKAKSLAAFLARVPSPAK